MLNWMKLGSLGICLLAMACSKPAEESAAAPEATGKLVVYATNYPIAYMAERIGGDAIDLRFPIPEGKDPAYWKPSEDDIAAMQSARLLLTNGAKYENWLEKATLPESIIVNTSSAVTDRYIETEDAVVHSHGPEGTHSHAGLASTTWLDPAFARAHAEGIAKALTEKAPGEAASFDHNLTVLLADFDQWAATLDSAAEPLGDRPLFASHPVYQYLERRMGLNLVSMHWEPNEMPESAAWTDFDQLLERHAGQLMLWEDEPLPETRAALEERGVVIVVYPPCFNRPGSGDFLSVMLENAANLETALAATAP